MEQQRTGERGEVPVWGVVAGALTGLCVLVVAGAIGMAAVWHQELVAEDLLLPGTAISGVDLGGASAAEARQVAEAAGAEALDRTVAMTYAEQRWEVRPTDVGGFADIDTAVEAVVAATRDASPLRAGLARWLGIGGKAVHVRLSLDDRALAALVEDVVAGIDRPVRDATAVWNGEDVQLLAHETGQTVDRDAALASLRAALIDAGPSEVPLVVQEAPVAVTSDAVEAVLPAVAAAAEELLDRPVTLVDGDREWTVTARGIGGQLDLQALVDEAMAAWSPPSGDDADLALHAADRSDAGPPDIVLTATPALEVPDDALDRFVAGIAEEVDVPVRDAALNLGGGWVELVREQEGRVIDRPAAAQALAAALAGGPDTIVLPTEVSSPEVTAEAYEHVLLVRQDQRKLYLFRDGEVVREWPVAIGAAGYGTPTGVFTIGAKRAAPTWINPAPNGWGAAMPAQIGPGPNNPLGLRALNWLRDGNETLIRFHGTANLSSIGTAASKGCVRLRNSDVVELFDLVPTGTTIVSTWG